MDISSIAEGAAALKAGLESMKLALGLLPAGADRDRLATEIHATEAALHRAEGSVAIGRGAYAAAGGVAVGDGARAGPGSVSIGAGAGPRGQG